MPQLQDKALTLKISRKIRIIRSESGTTLEELYNDNGIHLARIESGFSNITVSTLNAICSYFDLTLKDFYNDL